MKTPDIFDIKLLQPPELTKGECERLSEMTQMEGWEVAAKLWQWQSDMLNIALINAKENHALIQGKVVGMALARKVIQDAIALAEEGAFDVDTKKEDEFYSKWSYE